MLEVQFDGLCDPNPGGICTYGFLVRRDGETVLEEFGRVPQSGTPQATNNVAEYTALLRALERLVELGWKQEPVHVRGDSQLVIQQMQGFWKVRAPFLKQLCGRARDLTLEFPKVTFEWIERSQNREADALCWKAHAEIVAPGR